MALVAALHPTFAMVDSARFVRIVSVVFIAVVVSMWPSAYRTIAEWRSLPTSVYQCPDPQELMHNRIAKINAISAVFLTIAGIPAFVFIMIVVS